MTGARDGARDGSRTEAAGVPERWPEDPWRRRGVWLLYGLLAAAAVYVLIRNLYSLNDYRHFLHFGQATLAGLMPYDPAVEAAWYPGTWATWPPSFAPVAALLARLDAVSQPATIFLWQAANLAALGLVLAVYTRWLHGRRLSLRPAPGRLPLYALPAMVGLLVPARLLLSNFEHTQSNLLFLGLAVAGFALFRHGRRWGGGAAVGLATAFKATPLLVLPYLAWRGRWRDLGAALAGCGLTWIVLPGAAVGPGQLGRWFAGWREQAASLHLPTSQMNQSLQATLTRLAAPAGPTVAPGPEAGLLGGHGAEPWMLAAAALMVVGSALAFGRPLRAVSARREALELGVVFTAMGLFSPIGWKFHFVGLMPLALALGAALPASRRWSAGPGPSAAAAAGTDPARARTEGEGDADASERAEGAGEGIGALEVADEPFPGGLPVLDGAAARVVAGLLVGAALVINGTATDLIGGAAADAMERWGVVTWPALALVAAALWVLWRGHRSRDSSRDPGSADPSRGAATEPGRS